MKNNAPSEQNNLKQMFVLNWISNLNSGYATEKQSDLEKNILQIKDCLEKPEVKKMVGGEWKVVWGPAIGNTKTTRTYKEEVITRWATDNAMYVAQKEGTEDYFIGISGTNSISLKGWFEQDFDVEESIAWPPEFINSGNLNITGNPRISKAGNTGLQALWDLKPVSNAIGQESETLINFLLHKTKNRTSSISVGGHSLGGCLTPLMATAIADRMQELDLENPKTKSYGNVSINAYPTAGPTPGNQDFANHLQSQMNTYHAVYNAHDLVPASWDFSGLNDLTKAYGNWNFGILKIRPKTQVISRFLFWASNFAKHQNYVRLPKNTSTNFKVTTWNNELISEIKTKKGVLKGVELDSVIAIIAGVLLKTSPNAPLKRINNGKRWYAMNVNRFVRFLMQVLLQHVPAYTNPAPGGTAPWIFTDEEKEQLKNLSTRAEPSKATTHWSTATGIELMRQLAEKAADWLDQNTDQLPEMLEESQLLHETEKNESDFEAPVTAEEAMLTLEKLLEDSPELTEALPFIGNPYSQIH